MPGCGGMVCRAVDRHGQVTDVVLKTKGMLLGVGSSTVAVPIERAHVNGDEVTVTMTESEIEDLPEHRG